MGNTPSNPSGIPSPKSHHHRSPRLPHHARQPSQGAATTTHASTAGPGTTASTDKPHPPAGTAPSAPAPAVSPRRRRSLELPDLNKRLTLTDHAAASSESSAPPAFSTSRVRSPLVRPPNVEYSDDDDDGDDAPSRGRVHHSPTSPLGNTPPKAGQKRINMTTGTRARSPTNGTPSGGQSDHGSGIMSVSSVGTRDGVPIPGVASTTRRAEDLSYFPPIKSSHHDASQGTALAPPLPPSVPGRQPSPARPAPAVVTTSPVMDSPGPASHEEQQQHDAESLGLPTPRPGDPHGASQQQQQPSTSSPPGIPTVFTWTEGGSVVQLTGTFTDPPWHTRLPLAPPSESPLSPTESHHHHHREHVSTYETTVHLPPGTHKFKFIIDGHWRCSSLYQTATDGDGNLINWIQVVEDTNRRRSLARGEQEATRVQQVDEDWGWSGVQGQESAESGEPFFFSILLFLPSSHARMLY